MLSTVTIHICISRKNGETMNYWALMERVEDYNEHLMGYVELPRNSDRALDIVINPKGSARDKKIAWGNRQLKL
eukprot:scaffold134573_cov13-Prasinocladus_malaysianus.AAC.1